MEFQRRYSIPLICRDVAPGGARYFPSHDGLWQGMIFFSFFTASYAMQTILQEDEEGTLARLFTTPTPRSSILAGKFLAVFFTVIIQG
jgi:ABC-type transport system involved in multi-copper enzyme maturation permease subunit